jgi:hypothetical protein
MNVNTFEGDVFGFTPAVALARGHRSYEDEEEEPEAEDPEQEEREEDEEEGEPEEILWRSSAASLRMAGNC